MPRHDENDGDNMITESRETTPVHDPFGVTSGCELVLRGLRRAKRAVSEAEVHTDLGGFPERQGFTEVFLGDDA
jgi:hypothetical protein